MLWFIKKYPSECLAMQLSVMGSKHLSDLKYCIKQIKYGWIGKMGSDGMMKEVIKDPFYTPKVGEVFSLFDGMFGSVEGNYVMTETGFVMEG